MAKNEFIPGEVYVWSDGSYWGLDIKPCPASSNEDDDLDRYKEATKEDFEFGGDAGDGFYRFYLKDDQYELSKDLEADMDKRVLEIQEKVQALSQEKA